MYRKLISLGLIKSNKDQFDGISNEETMNTKYNFLIDNFDVRGEYESKEEYDRRIKIHKFIVEKMGLTGDLAISLSYMMINRIKYGVNYDEKYEKILNSINI